MSHKLFCKYGHPRTKENLIVGRCKVCRRISYHEKRRLAGKWIKDTNDPNGRTCRHCGIWKSKEHFGFVARVKSGLRTHCKECRRAISKAESIKPLDPNFCPKGHPKIPKNRSATKKHCAVCHREAALARGRRLGAKPKVYRT